MRLSRTLILALAATVTARAVAQDTSPLALTRLNAPIVFDGVPNEAAWRAVTALPLTMYQPVFRGQPTQRSEIRVAYDDEHLYAAAWFYDTDPRGIRINSLYRDRWNGDDAFALYIDTFNDKQNSKWFGVTPAGMRFDQLVSDDGNTLNGSWDAFWSARTAVTDSGWFAEVRIPFSTLGFRADGSGEASMGLTAVRLLSRLNERVTFPAIDPRFDFRRPSVAQTVTLQDVRPRTPVYVTPYLLAGESRSAVPGPPSTAQSREIGVDIRYPLSPKLTLDLTANTDFAQVEADDQQVNLDRFPLFFPERRRFFQEGSGIFDFATGSSSLLFHSRRIGLAADGAPIPVLGGARLVGRAGSWDVGVLDMLTDEIGSMPRRNFGVARLRRPVLNANSTAGAILTSYIADSVNNHVMAADASLRVTGDLYLIGKLATSVDSRDSAASFGSRTLFDVRADRRTQRGLAYTVTLTHAGEDYRPEIGFLPRRDFTTNNWLANWYFFTDESKIFRRVWPGALAFSTYRNGDRAVESGQYAVWLQWETKAGGGGWIEPKLFRESVVDSFNIGGTVDIPPGDYDFADLQFVLTQGAGSRLRASMDLRSGTYFDGTRTQLILTPTWNASKHLELGADYQATRLRFDDRNQKADIHVARLRVRTALDARASGNAFVQYNSTTDRVDLNVRLRYAFAEGTDLWLVYNEGLDTERTDDPVTGRSPHSLARTLIIKYTHTFGF